MLKMVTSLTANWQELLLEAGDKLHIHLNTSQESYLVFLLMRYTNRSEWVHNAFAISFLQSALNQSLSGYQEVGDQCLLVSGLFPGRAHRKNVPISYIVSLGQSAYASVAQQKEGLDAILYKDLSQGFIDMMDLLLQIRTDASQGLEPLDAMALYEDTKSRAAKAVLQQGFSRAVISGPSKIN